MVSIIKDESRPEYGELEFEIWCLEFTISIALYLLLLLF